VIPVLEKLFHARFTKDDGLGALIVSPTRELAMQIFQVLTTVGKGHYALSVGLVVGGKDFEEEKAVIGRMNILVATPGRLLQVCGVSLLSCGWLVDWSVDLCRRVASIWNKHRILISPMFRWVVAIPASLASVTA
jgi:hypothetical protein